MKLQIFDGLREVEIEGFETISFPSERTFFANKLNEISDNECDVIMAPEMLSYLSLEEYATYISLLISKIRMNGELVVGGTELRAFANAICSGALTPADANTIIRDSVSMVEISDVLDLVSNIPGVQYSWSCTGVHYEIRIRRV